MSFALNLQNLGRGAGRAILAGCAAVALPIGPAIDAGPVGLLNPIAPMRSDAQCHHYDTGKTRTP